VGRGVGLIAVVAVAVGAWLSVSAWTARAADPAARPDSDFQILWAAGQGLADGADVTDPAVLDSYGRRAGRDPTPFSASQPLVARLFGLLQASDFDAAWRIWFALHGACGVAAIALLAVAIRRGMGVSSWVGAAVALGAVGLSDALPMSLAMNSTNLVALLAIAGALVCATGGRSLGEGALLGLAVLAKTAPALLVVAALAAGRIRTAVTAVAVWLGAGAISVAWQGWEPHRAWLANTAPRLSYAPDVPPGGFNNALHTWNLSPHGLFSRAAEQAGFPSGLVAAAMVAVAFAVVWQLVLVARRQRGRDGAFVLGAAAVAGSFLVSSVTWPHHLVLASVPVAACAVSVGRSLVPAGLGLVAGAVLALPIGVLGEAGGGAFDGTVKCFAAITLFAAVCALPVAAGREPDEEVAT